MRAKFRGLYSADQPYASSSLPFVNRHLDTLNWKSTLDLAVF